LGYLVEGYLSEKTYNEIKVTSLNLDHYPQITMNLTLNGTTNILLVGELNQYEADMKYHLVGESFRFNNFHIDDALDFTGEIVGPFSALLVKGEGRVFDGEVTYRFTKIPKKMSDVTFTMQGVKSQKVLNFLEKPLPIEGRADIRGEFKYFSKYEKQGEVTLLMPKVSVERVLPTVPLFLTSRVTFHDALYSYEGEVDSKVGHLSVKEGTYHQAKKVVEAKYGVEIADLAYFERFLNHQYIGSLSTTGRVVYDDTLMVRGNTHTFGGLLAYTYQNSMIDVTLKSVSLEKLLKQYNVPALFSSNIDGTINYDTREKMVLIDTILRETRFRKTKITKMLYDRAGIDLLSGVYDKSSFRGGYQKSLLTSELKIDDGKEHLYLTNMKMDAKSNSVDSKFEIKMQGQEIYGDIYGTLQEPKVSIDMSRLLKYQMSKKLDALMDGFF
jgi:hypothetical protein